MISLLIDPTLEYPSSLDFFSPDEQFPEYPFTHLSSVKNPIYRAVRNCIAQSGLDSEHFNTPLWNPFGGFIKPGDRIFVLCNFANERRSNELVMDFQSRCTHGSVLRAIIDYILIATARTGTISFGNAPTQFCHWNQVLADTGADRVLQYYHDNNCQIEACDLRLYVTDASYLGAIRSVERRDETRGVHVNLGADSLLTALDLNPKHRYRIMNYDPSRTEYFHSGGKHEYVVNRQILDADVIFSIPKLKTHEKVGISCAIKGFVGTVGHKESLPHHRFGSPNVGGDEYPSDRWGVLQLASGFHERVQHTTPDSNRGSVLRAAYRVLRRAMRPIAPIVEGAWWGNDTAWRMVLDLVRIATYASNYGEMQTKPCRRHLVMIDGIYGGEGEGPAFPTAVRSGVLLFGDNLPAVDTMNALLMGFDPEKIPLVREASCLAKYPIASRPMDEERVIYKGQNLAVKDFQANPTYHFKPSDGWLGKI